MRPQFFNPAVIANSKMGYYILLQGYSQEWRILGSEKKNDYANEIFLTLNSARSWTIVILAGKRDRRRHSTTTVFSENVVVTE